MRGIHWDEGNGRPVLASSLVLCDMKYFVVKRTFLLGSDSRQKIYALAIGNEGLNNGWQTMGTWLPH